MVGAANFQGFWHQNFWDPEWLPTEINSSCNSWSETFCNLKLNLAYNENKWKQDKELIIQKGGIYILHLHWLGFTFYNLSVLPLKIIFQTSFALLHQVLVETSLTGRLIWGGEALIQSDNINNICFRGRNTDTHCWWRRWWRWDVKMKLKLSKYCFILWIIFLKEKHCQRHNGPRVLTQYSIEE